MDDMLNIKTRKSNIRNFLKLCAKVAGAESYKDRELLFMTALKDRVFQITPGGLIAHGGKLLESDEQLSKHLSKRSDNLVCVVKTLAELLSQKKPFWIAIDHGKDWIDASSRVKQSEGKILQFYNHYEEETPPGENVDPVEECHCNDLVDTFFDNLNEYARKRDIDFLRLPLGICEWCGNPFFGNRYDQRFCSKIHGQRWHAKQSYNQKKALE